MFPAVVTHPGGTLRNARAVITRERVYVWTDRGTPVVTQTYDPAASRVPRINAARSARAALTLRDGTSLTVEGQRGCGCGNPLKGWTPWRPYRKATTP